MASNLRNSNDNPRTTSKYKINLFHKELQEKFRIGFSPLNLDLDDLDVEDEEEI
ncbi:hypothetical protein [Candidatus Harpocratesius sp.]